MTKITLAPDRTWFRIHFRKTPDMLVQGEAELQRILKRKSPKAIYHEAAKTHQCSYCEKVEAWLPSWIWWGSYADLDEGRPVLKFCSDDCKERYAIDPDRKEPPPARPQDTNWKLSERINPHEPGKWDRGRYGQIHQAKKAADPRVFPHPQHPKDRTGNGWCRWCGLAVKEAGRRTWHAKCLRTFFLHTRLDEQVAHVAARDGLQCAICQGGASWKPKLGYDGKPQVRLHQEGGTSCEYCQITLVPNDGELEYDHVVPLWSVLDLNPDDRRPFFGPDNGWLLCKPHHKAKTKKEAADRALARAAAPFDDDAV